MLDPHLIRRSLLLASAAMIPATGWAGCTAGSATSASAGGTFSTSNGQIIGPNGQPFVARGINVYDSDMGQASQILATFPGLNFIRLNIYSYQDPSAYQAFIQQMSAAGVVVEVEDHTNSTGSNAGGGSGSAFTGQQLTDESNWYASMASAYAGNPYVWFGTNNEPPPGGLSAWEQATYNAIRGTGNKNPILMEEPSGGVPSQMGAGNTLNSSVYASMTNIVWDDHYYGWVSGDSTDQATVDVSLTNSISLAQQIQSANGTVPVIIGEYGDSTDGQSIDANWQQVVNAVTSSGLGSAAWNWSPGAPGDNLQSGGGLSVYGQAVASYIASSRCAAVAQATVTVTAPAVSTEGLSVAQVAQLAASGLPEDAAASPPAPWLLTRTENSPGGTSPPPPPVDGSVAVNVAGDYGTATAAPGAGSGAVSGGGNVLTATAGPQALMVTGPGNVITLGPYDDAITVQSAGNTINGGGGADTITLAYGHPGDAINADDPAVAPLATTGNVFVAPPAGTGTLTIVGTLASNDTIDLTEALAGTTWDHQPGTMWSYVSAVASDAGCEIIVGGQVIVRLPNGSPTGNIGPFIVAH